MCGKRIPYWNPKDVPQFCESKVCRTNYEYQQKHKDTRTGEVLSSEEIKKW